MRTLLGIIAGLIISDLLKATVSTVIDAQSPTADAWAANVLAMTAATLFVLRVLADNVLYYAGHDGGDPGAAYARRVGLLLNDLCSYALCYGIVVLLAPGVGGRPLPTVTAAGVILCFALVEALHWLWCKGAHRLATEAGSTPDSHAATWLAIWRGLSGRWALAWITSGGFLFCFARTSPHLPWWAGLLIFAASVGAAWHYLARLQHHYVGAADNVG